jgi:hypothetical protein
VRDKEKAGTSLAKSHFGIFKGGLFVAMMNNRENDHGFKIQCGGCRGFGNLSK